MIKVWKKKSQEEIKATVFEALNNNINYDKEEIAIKYGLVLYNHDAPNWYKIVIMEHVSIEKQT